MNKEIVEFSDPLRGERLLAVPALELDVALIHADFADEYGNVQFEGTGHTDQVLGSAAKRVLVQADRIVSNDFIRRAPERTRFWRDTVVAPAPWGSHPYAGATLAADREHLREYVKAAQAAVAGEREALDAYIDRYILQPETHLDYLECVGIRRIAELTI